MAEVTDRNGIDPAAHLRETVERHPAESNPAELLRGPYESHAQGQPSSYPGSRRDSPADGKARRRFSRRLP